MTDLQKVMQALVAEGPIVPDWPGLVGKRVALRRRRRVAVTAAAAVAALSVGMVVVSQQGPPAARLEPAVRPDPGPTADAEQPVVVFLNPQPLRVRSGVRVTFVVTARGYLEGSPSVLELVVDGRQNAPDPEVLCAGLPPGAKQPPVIRKHTEVRRVFDRTLTPGRHVVQVRAEGRCTRPGGTASMTYEVLALP